MALACAALCSSGCSEDNFAPVSRIASVRILAAQANKPYAQPGDGISLRLLADDGTIEPLGAEAEGGADGSSSLKYYWLKAPCQNPLADLYYACYPGFAATFQPGEELHPASNSDKFLVDDDLKFQLPADIITSHPPVEGSVPFGSVFAFAMACDGDHVRYLGLRIRPSPQSPPFGCFASDGTQLGSEHFVFAFARIYAFQERVNQNPIIERLTFNGQTLERADLECAAKAGSGGADAGADPDGGAAPCRTFSIVRCTEGSSDDCPTVDVDVSVPPESQESDPSSDLGREQVWVNYYATGGRFEQEARLLYDVNEGRLSDTEAEFLTPRQPGKHKLWAVVHDNRGGVEWAEATLIVE
jgi:hypothetical protein